jgi:RNA polymerase primary sigma factor
MTTVDMEPTSRYLQDISRTPLLTHEQEISKSERVQAGLDAARTLADQPQIARKERARLEQIIVEGHEARQQLTQANLRLVTSIAKKYTHLSELTFDDLVQEGNIGLMRAVERFDPTKGNRFSTYATWWIRQAVTRAIAMQARAVRLPVHMGEKLKQARRLVQGDWTIENVMAAMQCDRFQARTLIKAHRAQPLSLDMLLGDDDDRTLGSVVPASCNTEADAIREVLSGQIRAAVGILTMSHDGERKARILELRYGLDDGQQRSLEQVGQVFGITRERARQLEKEALEELKTLTRSLEGAT